MKVMVSDRAGFIARASSKLETLCRDADLSMEAAGQTANLAHGPVG
jgi:hypothetical protein